jgi:hypothetical protein
MNTTFFFSCSRNVKFFSQQWKWFKLESVLDASQQKKIAIGWGSSLVFLTPMWDGDDMYALASNTTNLDMLVNHNLGILSFLYTSLLSFKNVLSWYHNVIFFCFSYVSIDLFIFLISISFMISNVNWKWVFY